MRPSLPLTAILALTATVLAGCGTTPNCTPTDCGTCCADTACIDACYGNRQRDGGDGREDGGARDAGDTPEDGGGADAGAADGGGALADGGTTRDAGTSLDGGTTDGGANDDGGATVDAGSANDGGVALDAGTQRDAGTAADAGMARDAGIAGDAGAAVDAGIAGDGGPGCGSGELRCGPYCVDPAKNRANCGACGRACGAADTCVNGTCQPTPTFCPPWGCPSGSFCDLGLGRCVSGCLDEATCGRGAICESRACVAGCREDSQCSDGAICQQNRCVFGCRDDAQCGPSNICENNRCRGGCRADSQCGAGNICEGLQCRVGCRNDGQCGPSNICEALLCRVGCRDDGQCGANRICDTLQCRAGCRGAQHLCNGVCVSDESPLTCGSRCTPCPSSSGRVPACGSGQCELACPLPQLPCASGCCMPAEPSAGGEHTCVRMTNGEVGCFGNNGAGQLGDGTKTERRRVTPVSGLSSAVQLAAGVLHTCAALGDRFACWGANFNWQLGVSTVEESTTPIATRLYGYVPDEGGSRAFNVREVAVSSGRTYMRGTYNSGENGISRLFATGLTSNVINHTYTMINSAYRYYFDLAPGGTHTCFGAHQQIGPPLYLVCEGDSDRGQLFNSRTTGTSSLYSLGPYGKPVTGDEHTCVAWENEVRCAGLNTAGQAGTGSTATSVVTPGVVAGLTGTIVRETLTAGDQHTCVMAASDVYCWGANARGQLGDGTTTARRTATRVPGLGPVKALSAGSTHTCAIKTNDELVCWGGNNSGQLGDGTTTQRTTPTPVVRF